MSEKVKLPIKKENHTLTVDGISASWFLFNFSRNNKKTQINESFKTLLPDGSLQVVNINVESFYKNKKGKVTLPGAFAQDILLAMIDGLVSKVRNDLPELNSVKNKRGQFLPVLNTDIPKEYTRLNFKNKDLAQKMGMTQKNARITETIKQLHKTHIQIEGAIYKNDKIQKIIYETYYLPTISVGKKLRGGMKKEQLHQVEFDEMIVRQLLGGYIAKVNKEKLLALSSGLPRKMYTLLSAKRMSSLDDDSNISISESELQTALQLTDSSFKKYIKKYIEELIDTGVLDSYQISDINSEKVYFFEFNTNDKSMLGSEKNQVEEYFNDIKELCKRDKKLNKAINSECFDIDEVDLLQIIEDMKVYHHVAVKKKNETISINKAIYWCDQLLWNIICGQNNFSTKKVLSSCLKKDEAPSLRNERKYVPTFITSKSEKNRKTIEKDEQLKRANEKRIYEKIKEVSKMQFDSLDETIKKKFEKLYKDFKSSSVIGAYYPEDVFNQGLTEFIIQTGRDFDDLKISYEEYKKSILGDNNSEKSQLSMEL